MKNIYLFLFIFISHVIFACDCPPINPVSKDICNTYDIIFSGKVDSVSVCNVQGFATAYFTIDELYKGSAQQNIKINFDCSSSCMMSFVKDEKWLIYSSFQKFDVLNVVLCSHCRKFFNETTQDFYQVQAQRTFDQEKKFLRATLGIQHYSQTDEINQQQSDLNPRNEQPGGFYKLGLLLISFATMAVVYFVTRNKNKNDK